MRNKSNFITLSFFIFATISFAQGKFTNYHDDIRGFSISFPSDWELKKDYMNTAICAFSVLQNKDDDFREGVSVGYFKKDSKLTLDEFYKTNLRKSFLLKDNYYESESGLTKIAEKSTKYLICSYSVGGMSYKSIYFIFFVNQSTCCMIAGVSVPNSFNNYRIKFAKIAHSFVIDK